MHHAVDVAGQADEQAELGNVLDLAFEHLADRMRSEERRPRVVEALLEPEADAPPVRIDIEHHDLDLLAGRDDLARVDVLLGPAHLRDVDQALDARLELHEGAVVGDVGDPADEFGAHRVLGVDAVPRVRFELLHAEADALGLAVEPNYLDVDGLADRQNLGRMIDAPPGDVGDMKQAVDAAEIDESAVVGDVLDDALEHLALLEVGQQLGALLGPRLLEHGAARDDDVAAMAVHLEDAEFVRHAHQRRDIAHRADVDLAARQEGDGAREIDREAALDAAEDRSRDPLGLVECLLELDPGLLAARLITAQHRLAFAVFEPLEINFDLVADLDLGGLPAFGKFLQRHAAFGLEADVDQRHVVFDGDDDAGDHGTFDGVANFKRCGEQRREILAGWGCFFAGSGGRFGHAGS